MNYIRVDDPKRSYKDGQPGWVPTYTYPPDPNLDLNRSYRIAQLEAENRRLRAWKEEALTVLGEWDEVWQRAGRPGGLGASKPEGVWNAIQGLQDTVEYDSVYIRDLERRLYGIGPTTQEILEAED